MLPQALVISGSRSIRPFFYGSKDIICEHPFPPGKAEAPADRTENETSKVHGWMDGSYGRGGVGQKPAPPTPLHWTSEGTWMDAPQVEP